MQYKNLRAEMVRKDVSIEQIAALLDVGYNTAGRKLRGQSPFLTHEAIKIKRTFFPGHPIEYLFDSNQDEQEVTTRGDNGLPRIDPAGA